MLTPASLSSLVKLRRLVALPFVAVLGLLVSTSTLAIGQTTVSPVQLQFSTGVPVGSTAPAQAVTFTNNQATALTISGISVSGPFAISANTCPTSPATLGAGASCSVSITFTALQSGLGQGLLTITDNASNSPTKVILYGSGTTGGATLVTPDYLVFGNVGINQASAPQTVTLTNNKATSIIVTGTTVPAHFKIASNSCSIVAAGGSCNIAVTFNPVAIGSGGGPMFITDSADPSPVEVYVSGVGVIPVTVTPSPLAFGNIPVGVQTLLPITITNNQSQPLSTVGSHIAGAGFTVVAASSTCPFPPTPIPAGTTCTAVIGATPPTAGPITGTFTLVDNASNSPQAIPLSATGVTGTFVSTTAVSFGNSVINTKSALKTVILHNILSTAVTISSISLPGGSPFAIDPTSTCVPGSFAGGASCNIYLSVTPTAPGPVNATLTITDTAAGSPQNVALTAVGVPAVQLSATSLAFGSLAINTISANQLLTVTNNQSTALAISALSFTGPYSLSSVAGSTTCPNPSGSLAAGATCAYAIVFKPTATGAAPGTFTITDNAATSPQSITLSGTGIAQPVTISPTSLAFGNIPIGVQTLLPITITNNQSQPLSTIGSNIAGAGFTVVAAGSTCPFPPTPIPPTTTCIAMIGATPTSTSTITGTFTLVYNAANSPQTVSLSATGVPATFVSTTAVNFGNAAINTKSALKTVTLHNTLSTAVTISSFSIPAGSPFAIDPTSTCVTGSFAGGASCNIYLSVTPTAPGAATGTLTITDTAAGSPQTVALSAIGVPAVQLSSSSLSFGSLAINTISANQLLTVTNNQSTALAVSALSFTGPYSLSSVAGSTTCPNPTGSLAPGASCAYAIVFKPTATGAAPGTFAITDSAVSSPQSITLSGTGVLPVVVSPGSLAFGNIPIGTSSTPQAVTLTNNLATALSISSFSLGGSTQFSLGSSTCGATLASGASCTVNVIGSPTVAGPQSGTLSFVDSGSNSPQTVTLSETGTGLVTALPGSLAFGNVPVGTSSTPQTVTLTNNLATTLTISSFSLGGSTQFSLGTSTCGASLASGASCTVNVIGAPTATGSQTATLNFVDSASNSPQTVSLSETGIPQVTVSPGSLAFGSVPIGTNSTPQTVTLTNNLTTAISISSFSLGGSLQFSLGTSTCSATLAGGASCTVNVIGAPTAGGPQTGTLSFVDSASNSPQTVTLSETGTGLVTASPSSLTFGNVPVGTNSTPQTVTLTNNLATTLTISSFSLGGSTQFSLGTSTCGASLASGASCTVNVIGAPTATGPQSATLSFVDSASNSPQTVSLSETGILPVTVSPSSLAFGNVPVGTSSTPQTVTLTNNLATALSISSFSLGGSLQFSLGTSTCGATLASGASCTVNVIGAPTATGLQSGTLNFVDSASNSPQTVSLSETGFVSVTVSPTAIAFGNVAVGTNSTPQTATLTNNLTTAISISSFSLGVGTQFSLGTSTCGASLAAGASCTVNVIGAPTATGPASDTLSFVDSASNSPQTVTLTETGIGLVTVSPGSLAFGNVAVGTTTAAQTVTLTNNQGSPLSIASVTAAAPFAVNAGTTTCGASLASGASCAIGITASPTSPTTSNGTLTITDGASNSPQTVSLSVTGTSPLTPTPSPLAFGQVVVGVQSVQNVTLNNTTGLPITIGSAVLAGSGYSMVGGSTTCGSTLAAGASCVYAVGITAPAVGSYPGSLTITDNSAGSPQVVTITANAVPAVTLSSTSLTFATQLQGTTSAFQSVTLTNNQLVPLSITSELFSGADPADFGLGGTCPNPPNTLAPLSSCTVSVNFTPITTGTRTGTLTISDNAATVPSLTITLTGNGNAPLTITPPSALNYTAPVGTSSTYVQFTVTNTNAGAPVHISSFQTTGDFSQTQTSCPIAPAALGNAASCVVTVNFIPTIAGTRGGQLLIYDDTVTSPQVVNLQGIGTNPLTLSTNAIVFPATKIATSSAGISATLTNHESQSETFSIAVAGPFSQTNSCPSGVIAGNSSCTITSTFSPTTAGPNNGSLTITHSAVNGSPLTLGLSGSAITNNPPGAVSSVSPAAGTTGTMVNAVITGNGWTNWDSTSTINFLTQGTQNACVGVTASIPTPSSTTANIINAQITVASNAVPGGCDIQVVTGANTDFLSAAFIVADPTNSHIITTVTPNFGTQGQTLNVNLTATGTSFQNGITYANFGSGIQVNSLTVMSPTTAQANITISNTSYVGYNSITLVTGGEVAVSGSQAFQILPNNATLVSVTPNTAPQGGSLPVNLVATGTHFLQGATMVSFTGGINVGNVQVTSPTTATVNIAVTPGATVGLQNVTVNTGGEYATLGNAFTVTGATPYLSSVTPSAGAQGQTFNVNFTGVFTNFATNHVLVNLGGDIQVNSYTVNSPTSMSANITVTIDAVVGGRTGYLTVGPSGNQSIYPFNFTVQPSAAQIVSVTPSNVGQGQQITLTVVGANTHWVQGTTTAQFTIIPVGYIGVPLVTIIDSTHAMLNIAVSSDHPVGGHAFYMSTGGEVVYSAVSVYAQTPTLNVSPANGIQGTAISVSFTGAFTHFGPTTLPVINGQGVTLSNFVVTSLTSATGTITISNTAPYGLRTITFTTGGEIVTTNFNVTNNAAYLYSISPYQSPQNNTLNVDITGVNTHFAAGTTVVNFDPFITVNSTTVNSLTDVVANITVLPNAFIGWHTAYVNTGAEQVIIGFYVYGPQQPTIVSVVPGSAPQGATANVTITGSLTNWVQGTTEAILGAGVTVSNLQIVSPTSATATISVSPTAPVGGNSVVMITGQEIESGSGFSVTPNAALIQSVVLACQSPAYANTVLAVTCGSPNGPPVVSQLQTVTLYVTGVGTHWLQGETTFNFGPWVNTDSLIINSRTTATVQITVLSGAPIGFSTLTTTTDGEVVSLQQAIDIEQGFAKLVSTTPGGALQGVTLNLQVLGQFTHWQQGVTSAAFNSDITVNSFTVIDSLNAIANITVSPLAYVDTSCAPSGHTLTITTGAEQVSIPGNFCVGRGPAQVTQVYPPIGAQGTTESVTITGSGTNWVNGITTANFGAGINVGNVTVNSPTSATVALAITQQAPTGYTTVTMTTLGEVAQQVFAFQVTPNVATLNEAIPNIAEQGAPLAGQPTLNIHLIGQYSHFSTLSTATFGAGITVNSVTYTDATDLTVNITVDPLSFVGGRNVTVTTPQVPCSVLAAENIQCAPGATTGSEIVSANIFSVIPGPAIITQVGPPSTGNQGQEVVFNITGSNTHWVQNITQFYIPGGGSDIAINSVVINSNTSATVDMTISNTAGTGARSIYMVTAGESLVDSGAFVVTGGIPVITYLSPNYAQPGTNNLNVVIHGLYTQWDNTSTLNFGPGITVNTFQVSNSTTIDAVISIDPAAQNGYRTVFVQTGAQGLASNFQVYTPPPPVPYISYFIPSSGLPGQTFTVHFTGANTHWDPVTTTANFGNNITMNTFQVLGPGSAIANITISPTAPASYNLFTLSTPTSSAPSGTEIVTVGFSIVVSVPQLVIVDPNSALQGANNVTVNVIGQYTNFDNTTTFNFGQGVTVNSVTILGPTVASVNVSVAQLAQLGGRSVTATTQGTTVGGAGFYVTPSLALISAISPNTTPQGTTITVDVQGQNTHWSPATVFTFGDGITVTNVVVNSPTDATVTISVPPLAGEGATGAQAVTQGEVATITNAFVVTPGTPYLLSSGPSSVPQQGTVTFTILSQATTWTTTPPTVSYGPGIVLTNTNVTGDTSLTVTGYAQPTTPVGYRNLTVSTGSQILTLGNAVYVSPGPAVVNSVSPATAGQGANIATFTINGTNTNWQQGVTTLSFPGAVVNSLTIMSANLAVANVTISNYATPGFVNITMTTLGEVATETNAFTITQTQPQILFINPASVVQGATTNVTITSLFTNFNGTTTATFGAGVTVNSVTALSATSLKVNITVQPTASLGYRNVSLTTGTQNVAATNLFQVTQGPAAIFSLNPNTGQQNQQYTIAVTGSQTNFTQGVTTASFGGGIQVTGLTVVDLLHANVQISIPSSTPVGNYNVSLTTAGEVASILGGFNVTTGNPILAVVNPPTGHQGDTNLNVSLTGLFTAWVNNTSTANFGAGITVNSLTVSDATDAVANITISPSAALGSRNVSVTTGGQVATITGGFSVLAGVPALVSSTPGTGAAGSTLNVVINGAFSSFAQATSSVSFGNGITVNFVTVANPTQLTANITIATNAAVGPRNITVTSGSQNLTLNNAFTVLPGTPVVTVINPNIGTPNASVTVTINGQYTNWINGTTVANFGPGISVGGAALGANGPVTVSGTGTLTASLTIDPAATLGPRTVTIMTNAELESVPAGFTVQATSISPPSLVSLSPGNSAGMPINSSIIAVFSQPMKRSTISTSSVLMYISSNQGQGYIPVAGAVTLDASGRVLTFTPSSLLAVNSQFYFQITNAVQDASGNTFPAYNIYLYTGFTADTTLPTVVAANPVANTTVAGTNVTVQLQFSADMNQSTQSGMTLSTGGTPVNGTYSWNSGPYCNCGGGTIMTFTPAAPLTASTTYTVAYTSAMTDTAGNALVPGSFNFTTGAGPDTANNSSGPQFSNGEGNFGTNFAPRMFYAKPINPIDINTGTLFIYNADSGKYILGSVTVAADGMSAQFTPTFPLLPQTAYQFYQAGGNYDMDGNYLYGSNTYFVTGTGSATTPPTVVAISPAATATSIPLNADIVLHMSQPMDSTSLTGLTVTPSGGSAITGMVSLASDQVTVTFTPTNSLLGNTTYTVQFSGFRDMVGNTGASYTSTFTTANSVVPLNVSTGFTSGGTLSTVDNTPDANWTVKVGANPPVAAEVVGPGDTGWYGGWGANGPKSSWIALNPNSVSGNTAGPYSTTFNLTGYSLTNLCMVGAMSVDDNGSLSVNGTPITGNVSGVYNLQQALNIPLPPGILNAGVNTLSLIWGSTDNSYEAFRLQATIQTCGSTLTGGLSVVSTSPSNAATGVSTATTITLNFNNPLDPATVSDTTLPVMYGWNSNQIIAGHWAVNGAQAVFTPDSPFAPNSTIYVGECGGPYDLAGDTYPSCYQYQLVYFTTSSVVTPPSAPFQVTAFSPGLNATGVGLRAPVTATFNRSFNPGTINPNSTTQDFNLYAGITDWCNSYYRSTDNLTLQFSCTPMPASSQMTALINSGLQDWAGNPVANFTSTFTTAPADSNTHGSITSTRPSNGASGIPVNQPLVFYASLPVNPSTANAGLQVAQNNVPLPGTVQVLDNGYTILFTPSAPLTPGALVQWWITGSLIDTQYNIAFTATNGYFYVAASTAATAPSITSSSPAFYTNPTPPNAIFDFQFNTPLDSTTVNSTNIYLYDSVTGLHVPATYTMPQPNEIRIVPTSNLTTGNYTYLYVTTGLHSSTSVPATATNPYFYINGAADNTTPTIVSAVPYNGAGNVGVNITPGFVFSKAIDPVSLNSSTFQITNSGTPLAGTYQINSTDTRIYFVPNAPLPASANLTMTLNGVLDLEGHPVNFSSTFQTAAGPDFQQPTVLFTSIPSNGSVPVNATLTATFSESMDINTFSPNTFHIYDYTLGIDLPATITWNSIQNVAYLVPTTPLAAGRQYNLYIVNGTDLAGNVMQNVSYTFYTTFASASSGPTVVNVNPINGTTGLGLNAVIQAQFSAPIDPNSTTNVTLSTGGTPVATTQSFSASNTILQLVPAVPLAANTTYTVKIMGVVDPAGNAVSTYTYTFTTGAVVDLLAATAINSNPPGNYTVGTNTVPKLIFNKPLNPITVNTNTFRMYLYQTGQSIPLTVTPSANGLEVTMTPQVPLIPGTEYYFQACCGFQDMDGNNGNGVNVYFYTGSGSDTTPPTVTFNPGSGATAIPLNTQINIAVNKAIDPTSWTSSSVQLFDNLNNPVAGTLTVPGPQTFLFVPSSNLNPGITYTVKVANFTDSMGNAVVPVNSTFTTGGTAATPGLTFTGANIPFGSTGVSATQTIILTFSQVLDPNTVNASTLKVMNTWNSNLPLAANYSVSGNQVTITPVGQWPAGAQIYVGECGGPTDILGDVFQNGNCYPQQLVYFVVTTGTPDTTPLTVLSVSPTNGATNVGINQQISVTFNKAINPNTVNGNDAIIFAGQGAQDRGSISLSADGRTIYFNTGALYGGGAAYTVNLQAGGISDYSGNSLANDFISTFTTASYPATGNGSVSATSPGANATGVPTNSLLTLYLNRAVNPATLAGNFVVTVNGVVDPGTVAATAGNFEVQFTPTTPFPNSAIIQWSFSGVLDVYGDYFNGNSGTFYTVAATTSTTAPQQIAVSPICCGSNVPVNTQVDIEFSSPIDPTTLAAGVNTNGTFAANFTLPFPNVIRVTPTSPFSPSTFYGVCTNSSLKGTNGVAVTGGCWNTYFYTTAAPPDTTPGTMTIGPPNGSVNVGTNAYVRLSFSKPVDETTINSSTVTVKNGATTIPGMFTYAVSNGGVTSANFSPTNPLPPSTAITVQASGILDLSGNVFPTTTSSFTTAATPDISNATVYYEFPGNTQNIGTNAIFTCRYTKPMDPTSFTAGNVYVYNYATSTKIPVTYTFSTDLMSVTMTPTTALTPNTQYNYECFNAIDLTGNAQNNNGGPYFYTGGGAVTTGPVLVYANPPNGSTNVPLNDIGGPWSSTNLMLQFNEPLAENSIGNITLTPQGGSPLAIGTSLQIGDTTVIVNLPTALLPNTTYTYSVNGVTDYNGNAGTPTTSSFTTGTTFDFVQPGVAAFVPANGATGVSDTAPGLKITFTEPMNPVLFDSSHVELLNHNTQALIPTTFTFSPDYMSVLLTPTAPLTAATIYDLKVNIVNWYLYDFAGNNLNVGSAVSTFTTQ